MPSFLAKSSCNGRRPSHLSAQRHFDRPDLITRLLRERHVARFLVAPDGFGKTSLVAEYADTVFSFEHTFWINGRSPCFLRDLDRGIIAPTLTQIDSGSFLVVVEDVPPLDAARAKALSDTFDELLERGCEVVATCTPACDAFASLQHDRMKLTPADLLLTDAEVDTVRGAADRAEHPAATVPACERVPALRWGAEAAASFVAGALREELPAEVVLVMTTALVLRTGTFADIEVFGPLGKEVVALLEAGYPYLGMDARHERFHTPDFPAGALAAAATGKLDALAEHSCFADRDTLVARWADALVAREEGERACVLVGALCSRGARATWLAARSRVLMESTCVLPAHELYGTLGKRSLSGDTVLELGEVVRLVVLGEENTALSRARRIAFDLGVSEGARAIAALVLARRAQGTTRDKALDELERIVHSTEGGHAAAFAPNETFWRPLALAQLALEDDPAELEQAGTTWRARGADEGALALVTSWVIKDVFDHPHAAGAHARGAAKTDVGERVGRYVRERVTQAGGERCDLFTAAAGLALERARERGTVTLPKPLGAAEVLALHRVEMELFAQRRAFERAARERSERRAERATTLPDAYLDGRYLPAPTRTNSVAPVLTVNLFGGLDVRMGDVPVDLNRFRRHKVKTLLALLVLNRGREYPRDKLVAALWPESDLDTARKNFYSIWSMLRRTLSGGSGTCPYLVRHQNGCRLDERLLVSDVARFDAVCRMLLFGQPGSEGWAQLYAEIDDVFADDLMPSEEDNEIIVQARADCRVQLVDALVAAAERLVAADDAQEGLWFARAALKRDRTREDAYLALMRAQIAAGQRTAALETYFSCRRFLTNELGIDPSLTIVELYHSIIETEELLE